MNLKQEKMSFKAKSWLNKRNIMIFLTDLMIFKINRRINKVMLILKIKKFNSYKIKLKMIKNYLIKLRIILNLNRLNTNHTLSFTKLCKIIKLINIGMKQEKIWKMNLNKKFMKFINLMSNINKTMITL